MSKINEKQIAIAKALLKQHPSEKQIFVKVENGHMYFKREAALISVGGDISKLEGIDANGETFEVKSDEQKNSKPSASNEPKALVDMKFTELKEYAEKNGITLEAGDNSRDKALARIQAAEAAKSQPQ